LAENHGGDQIPMYLEAAQQLSKLLGVPQERLLSDSFVPGLTYPTPECLLPEEVADYQRGLPIGPDRLMHAKSCLSCGSLLEAAAPNRELERAFLEEVERMPEVEPSPVEGRVGARHWLTPAFAMPLATAAAVLLCVANLAMLVRLQHNPPRSRIDPNELQPVIRSAALEAVQSEFQRAPQTRVLNSSAAPLSAHIKQLIANEVRSQVALENAEAKMAYLGNESDAASSGIQRGLSDGSPHIFVAGSDLNVVNTGGTVCTLSAGDALQVAPGNAPDANNISAAVLSSKGGKECAKGDTVLVAIADLQDMQNHMRETIDQGIQELQKKPGESAMASGAPPPQDLGEGEETLGPSHARQM